MTDKNRRDLCAAFEESGYPGIDRKHFEPPNACLPGQWCSAAGAVLMLPEVNCLDDIEKAARKHGQFPCERLNEKASER